MRNAEDEPLTVLRLAHRETKKRVSNFLLGGALFHVVDDFIWLTMQDCEINGEATETKSISFRIGV